MQQKVRTVSGHKSLPTYIYLILLLQINTALIHCIGGEAEDDAHITSR